LNIAQLDFNYLILLMPTKSEILKETLEFYDNNNIYYTSYYAQKFLICLQDH